LDLATLLPRCAAGDELAWEEFVRRFQGRLYGMACAYAGNPDDARELAQDVFVKLYAVRTRWPDADRFMPWMLLAARNLCVDYLRRRKARTKATEVDLDLASQLATSDPGPEAQAGGEGRRSILRRALARLTALSRDIIILRDIQGLSIAEVAAALRVPSGTVKSRASRARVELAEQVRAIAVQPAANTWRVTVEGAEAGSASRARRDADWTARS
jgi:RNA polymerase sigma-70 factor (ECF subfamily)